MIMIMMMIMIIIIIVIMIMISDNYNDAHSPLDVRLKSMDCLKYL